MVLTPSPEHHTRILGLRYGFLAEVLLTPESAEERLTIEAQGIEQREIISGVNLVPEDLHQLIALVRGTNSVSALSDLAWVLVPQPCRITNTLLVMRKVQVRLRGALW